jgi:hypothetical protein
MVARIALAGIGAPGSIAAPPTFYSCRRAGIIDPGDSDIRTK